MIILPDVHERGYQAMMAGTKMASVATPLGFTFNPFAPGSVNHFNFCSGVVQAVFGDAGEPVPMAAAYAAKAIE